MHRAVPTGEKDDPFILVYRDAVTGHREPRLPGRPGPYTAFGISITDVPQLTLAQVEDELYSLTPGEFVAVRDERARQARAADQRELAAAIKKLARPTASAWLVNQLTRERPEQMNHLFEVGEELLEAQRSLAGDRLRELSANRRRAVDDLLPEASRLAAHARQAASPTVLGEVRATLEAAVADPEARAAVRSGRLTKALVYAGLGEVDLAAALAAVPQPGRAESGPASSRGQTRRGQRAGRVKREARHGAAGQEAGHEAEDAERATEDAERATEDAERATEDAERATEDAEDTERAAEEAEAAEDEASAATAALEKADREAASLDEQRQFLRRRLDHLERELRLARDEDARLGRAAEQARGRAEQARASADAAVKVLQAARKRLAKSQRRDARH
jgi:hypothetical protein